MKIFSPRRRRIVHRPLENSRDWICRLSTKPKPANGDFLSWGRGKRVRAGVKHISIFHRTLYTQNHGSHQMSRMQRANQRPCADLSPMRRAGHRHHQTAAKGGAHRFGYSIRFHRRRRHHCLGYFSPTHEQGHGPAQGDSATTAVTLVTPSLTPAFSPRRRRIVRRPP